MSQYKSKHDKKTAERLKQEFGPLVRSLAKKFTTPTHSFDDLCQEGFINMFEKIDEFDPNKKVKVITFLYHKISGRLRHYIREQKAENGIDRNHRRFIDQIVAMSNESGYRPEPEEVCKRYNIKLDTYYKRLNQLPISLNTPIGTDHATLQDFISDKSTTIDESINKIAFQQLLDNLLSTDKIHNPETAKKVVLSHLNGKTQTEIARELGISQIKVSRTLNALLKIFAKELQK